MALPLVIAPNSSGHISHHEEIHAFLNPIVSPFAIAEYAQGTFASRPAAGIAGRYYRATDTAVLYVDSGSGWVAVHDLLKTWEASLLSTANNLSKLIVPACIATKSVAQTIGNNAATVLTFPTEDSDNDGMHDLSTLTGRLTINRAGLYVVGAEVGWELISSTTNVRQISFRVNSTTVISGPRHAVGNNTPSTTFTTMIALSATNYIECLAFPTTVPAQSVDVTSARFWAVMVSSI